MEPTAILALAIASSLLGTAIGIVTGLLPGLHTNNIAAVMVACHTGMALWAMSVLGGFGPAAADADLLVVCLVVSAAITHTFVNFVPATFLGAPEADTALSILPAHRLLMEGRGMVAVRLSAMGSLGALVIGIVLVLPLRLLMGDPCDLYERLRPALAGILVLVVALLVVSEGHTGPHAKGRNDIPFGPVPCIRVEGIAPIREGELLEERVSPFHPVRRFVRGWMLPGIQGARVTMKGVLSARRAGLVLIEREHIPLVLDGEGLRDIARASLGRRVWVVGRVSRMTRASGRRWAIPWALVVFATSGALGIAVLHGLGSIGAEMVPIAMLGMPAGDWMLLPLFTGLFGLPTMLLSVATDPAIPKQDVDARDRIPRREKTKAVVTGTAMGTVVGWYPGITSAEAGVLAVQVNPGEGDGSTSRGAEGFIVTVSAINTANAISNFVALFVILRARSGAARAARAIIGDGLDPWGAPLGPPGQLLIILAAILVSGLVAYVATVLIGRAFACHFDRIPYRPLVLAIVIFLVAMVVVFSGPAGVVVLVVATVIGTVPPIVGVKRVHLMGALVLPLILGEVGIHFGGWS